VADAGVAALEPSNSKPPAALAARRLAASAVVLGVFFGPLAFGATEVWSLGVLEALAALGTGLWLVSGPSDLRLVWLPIAVAVLGLVQVAVLPDGLLAMLSPIAHDAYAAAAAATGGPLPGRASISPGATLHVVRHWFLLGLVVAMAADLARGAQARQRMARAVAWIGVVVLAIGLAMWPWRGGPLLGFHDMRGPLKSYKSQFLHPMHSAGFGRFEAVRVGSLSYAVCSWNVGDTFGPYVVSNHYAGCLEMTLPLAVALLVCTATNRARRSRPARALRVAAAAMLGVAALATVAVGAKSWAGTAGLAVGLVWVGWQWSAGWARRLWGAALAAAVAIWVVLFALLAACDVAGVARRAEVPGAIQAAVESLQGSVRGRWGLWCLCARMFAESPWLGLGLGTFADAYPRFADAGGVLAFAHCDYLQLAAEAGLAGVAIAGVLAVVVARRVRRGWSRVASQDRALAAGLGASLAAFLPHGLFDWNLHVPANAWIFAVLVGLLFGIATGDPLAPTSRPSRGTRFLRNAVATGLIAATGVCLWATLRYAAADWSAMPLREALFLQRIPRTGLTLAEKQFRLEQALAGGLRAAELCPRDAGYAETLGQAFLHLSGGTRTADLEAARRWFRQALRQSPTNDRARRTLAEIERGLLEANKPLFDALRDDAGFRIRQDLYEQVLRDADE
jgi:O-antigen ligase